MTYLISVLIPTLYERTHQFNALLSSIYKELNDNDLNSKVEILSICDNRNMGLCKKRNMLQKLSTGKYFTHLDDDDRVVDGYFIKLVKHIEGLKDLPDIIAFDQICFVGEDTFIVKPDITLNLTLHTGPVKSEKDLKVYYRYPWQFHLFNERFKKVYRTESDSPDKINKPHMFDDVNFLKKIQLEKPNRMEYVNEILHEYHFEDPSKTTTQ
tara:strand:- start:1679 stop:2311 length:633 start_codon:yes stop_codon:yes gene_type:complete